MAVHVGKLLRELYLSTGLKMEGFRKGVPFAGKTIYYHFGQEHLNTEILEKYEIGLKKLGFTVDIYALLSQKRSAGMEPTTGPRRYTMEDQVNIVTEANPLAEAAESLEKAARILREQQQRGSQPSGPGSRPGHEGN